MLYWVKNEPAFGRQAVYLDDAQTPADLPSAAELESLQAGRHQHLGAADVRPAGARRRQPHRRRRTPRRTRKAAGLDIITWTLERSGVLADGNERLLLPDASIRAISPRRRPDDA